MQYNIQSLTNSSVDTLGLYQDTFVIYLYINNEVCQSVITATKLDISIITSEQLRLFLFSFSRRHNYRSG